MTGWSAPLVAALALSAAAVPAFSQAPPSLDSLQARATQDSLDPAALYQLGLGYWLHADYADAERAFRRSIVIDPRFANGYLALAYLPFARDDRLAHDVFYSSISDAERPVLAEAERLRRQAFLLDPLVDLTVTNLIARSRRRVIGSSDRMIWHHGLSYAHQLEFRAAEYEYRLLIPRRVAWEHAHPDSVDHDPFAVLPVRLDRYMLAYFAQRNHDAATARALYQQLLAEDPTFYMAHVQLAEMAEGEQDWTEALAQRRLALAADPADPSLLLDLGRTLAAAGRPRDAAPVLAQAERANPSNALVPYQRGLVELQLGNAPAARQALERFLAIAPTRYAPQLADARTRLATLHTQPTP